MNEGELVRAAQRGDEAALESLYRAHYDQVYRYLLFRTGNPTVAEDIACQVFLAVVRGLSRYRHGDKPFLAWLYGIARNQLAQFYRESARRPQNGAYYAPLNGEAEPVDEDGGPAEDLERREQRERLSLALAGLPDPQREVVLLRSLLDLSIVETAELVGKSEGAVKQLHRRGLSSLRTRLEALLPDSP
ncbi:MAG TPA: sigma-70 family RNA polymerase sigma factor [Thermoleophilia bacterium]|nr:sigma-70 family RNA polymerase sigma factor [Thermoleophilia bacterium]